MPVLGACARGGDRVPVLGAGAGCVRGGDRVLGKLANCGQLPFGANMVAHALIPKLWMWLMELCVNIRMP